MLPSHHFTGHIIGPCSSAFKDIRTCSAWCACRAAAAADVKHQSPLHRSQRRSPSCHDSQPSCCSRVLFKVQEHGALAAILRDYVTVTPSDLNNGDGCYCNIEICCQNTRSTLKLRGFYCLLDERCFDADTIIAHLV